MRTHDDVYDQENNHIIKWFHGIQLKDFPVNQAKQPLIPIQQLKDHSVLRKDRKRGIWGWIGGGGGEMKNVLCVNFYILWWITFD